MTLATRASPSLPSARKVVSGGRTSLTVQPCADGLLLQALLCAQNPGLNPELLAAALRTHLPACAPDFVRVMRLEVLDAAGEPFR